jgi:hypothetical protein
MPTNLLKDAINDYMAEMARIRKQNEEMANLLTRLVYYLDKHADYIAPFVDNSDLLVKEANDLLAERNSHEI